MQPKKLNLYIDTSVVGGYYDSEFETDTRQLFEEIKQGLFHVIVSTVTEDELLEAPEEVRALIPFLPKELVTKIELTEEAIQLADTYISENVVGQTSRDDCFHIALATINRADILVSWNFRHIVNVTRIRGYNAVNIKLGYQVLDIRSPKEIINNGN